MFGLLASRGLGVVRQTIFNAVFGTGLEANATMRQLVCLKLYLISSLVAHLAMPLFPSFFLTRKSMVSVRHGDLPASF